MPERSHEGNANIELFAKLLMKFGWRRRGDTDRDIKCQKCKKEHGVDGLFTIDCPYTDRERGIFVESKRYSMKYIGGPQKITDWMSEALDKVAHLRQSPVSLEETLGISQDMHIDTTILALYCHEGWDPEKMHSWVKAAAPGFRRSPAILSLVAENNILNRLQSIYAFREAVHSLEFYYEHRTNLNRWWTVLTPEMLFSYLIPI